LVYSICFSIVFIYCKSENTKDSLILLNLKTNCLLTDSVELHCVCVLSIFMIMMLALCLLYIWGYFMAEETEQDFSLYYWFEIIGKRRQR
jgi:hypothetical protein